MQEHWTAWAHCCSSHSPQYHTIAQVFAKGSSIEARCLKLMCSCLPECLRVSTMPAAFISIILVCIVPTRHAASRGTPSQLDTRKATCKCLIHHLVTTTSCHQKRFGLFVHKTLGTHPITRLNYGFLIHSQE